MTDKKLLKDAAGVTLLVTTTLKEIGHQPNSMLVVAGCIVASYAKGGKTSHDQVMATIRAIAAEYREAVES